MRFSDAITEFKNWKKFSIKEQSVKGYEYDLRNFCLYLRNPEIETVEWKDIQIYMESMVELGWDPNTFVRKSIAFRKFFYYWHKKNPKVLDSEWIPVMHAEVKAPRVIDEVNYKKLMDSIPRNNDPRYIRNLAMISLLWDTGARNSEILSLNIEDLNLEEHKAVIRTEKARTQRVFREIFWTDQTNEFIIKWLKKREHLGRKITFKDSDAVFFGCVGKKLGSRITKGAFGDMLRRYCVNASIPVFNPHSFRHHMGHDIIEKGGSNSDVSNILGHASLASSFIYTMLRNKELEKRYRVFKGV